MTRTIATLTIALLISAGTEAEAQGVWSGQTVETALQILMKPEDFDSNLERSEPGNYYHFEAIYPVPQITDSVLVLGTVNVHQCFYDPEKDRVGPCWPVLGPSTRKEEFKYFYRGFDISPRPQRFF